MAQNVYDDPDFFAGYLKLPRSVGGLDLAPEWPTLRGLLPAVAGRRVLDLGCGFGWWCRWAASAGATSVLGIDLSERMLERARTDTEPAVPIAYRREDLEQVELEPGSVEVAYSSLTLHYVVALDRLLAQVRAALVPGGALVASVEHPIFTAPSRPGFTVDDDGHTRWPVDRYLDEGPRTTDWLAPGVVKQHRTVGSYVRLLHEAGFALTDLVEWGPSPAQLTEQPSWAGERDRPAFLLLAARRA